MTTAFGYGSRSDFSSESCRAFEVSVVNAAQAVNDRHADAFEVGQITVRVEQPLHPAA